MQLNRATGTLLHPTSFPGRYGIGDLGIPAYQFIDFLAESKQRLWQILPLNPVGFNGSPYQSYSAFANNHLLISVDELVSEGLLDKEDIYTYDFNPSKIEWKVINDFKDDLLHKAFRNFSTKYKDENFNLFINKNAYWLNNYALFMALKNHFKGLPWNQWDEDIKNRDNDALIKYKKSLKTEINYHLFLQYYFYKQWKKLKTYANNKNIEIIGDIPIFIAEDSCDVWVYPHYFKLDDHGIPLKVAGVPPDYFSETGQRWGNPLYCFEVMQKNDYLWWRQRITNLLEYVDYIRIDHFRGFESYYEIPANEETAINGKWVKGPGEQFFSTLKMYLGDLPLIAEDLGIITPEVINLKDKFNLPGMKVLQFIEKESITENNKSQNNVYYTGTHDNDTLLGWYKKKSKLSKEITKDMCFSFIESLYFSKAKWVITPLQDLLVLDSKDRMNVPGTTLGNWSWRYLEDDLKLVDSKQLASLILKYDR
ncbi:4-alpha-glucanotransferase [Desulfonispora thiosulfatigenes DSM 11270]|uniref:4-alpha-glucanotransferase n=1 Tax=Desulfonispora thiosulfatigenes DSM 11270 TaxID=656914 RepID=A0A1W1VLY2_DESTI|nr:4-alpha-glucanotransferase [Desulfonispora thiosulfatigenes]SMB94326.1 4-alpha-glucanotransferase [Desulfonispora thiosulfatigenes DSM 11270]